MVIEGVRFWRAEARTLTVSCSTQVLFYFARECNAMQLNTGLLLCNALQLDSDLCTLTVSYSTQVFPYFAKECTALQPWPLCTWSGPSAKKVFAGARFETDNKAGITSRKWRKSASLGSFAIMDIRDHSNMLR